MTKKSRTILTWTAVGILAGVGLAAWLYQPIIDLLGSPAIAAAPPSDGSNFTANGDTIEVRDEAVGPAGIMTQTVQAADVPLTLTLTGKSALNLDTATHVQPQFGGKVKDIKVQLGQWVQGPDDPGGPTVLCVIESNDLAQAKSNWLQAKIQLEIDQRELEVSTQLYKAHVLGEKLVLDAQAAVEKDTAARDAAYQQLLIFGLKQSDIDDIEHQIGKQRMDYVITSPRSGVVAEKDVAGGEIASPGNNLFVIADTKTLWIVGDLYEQDLSRIKLGQAMSVYFPSDPNRPRHCKVDWISPVLDPTTHAVHVQGILDNSDGHVLSDMYCTIVVTIDSGTGSIIVPADAIVRDGDDAYAFVLAKRGDGSATYRRTSVKTGALDVGFGVSSSGSAAISSADQTTWRGQGDSAMLRVVDGIKPGDTIVTSGALSLYNEMKLQANGQ